LFDIVIDYKNSTDDLEGRGSVNCIQFGVRVNVVSTRNSRVGTMARNAR